MALPAEPTSPHHIPISGGGGGSQLPATPAPGYLLPSSGLQELFTCPRPPFLKKKKKCVFSRPKGGDGVSLCRDESTGVWTVFNLPSFELWVFPWCGFQEGLQVSLCEKHRFIIKWKEQPPPENPSPEFCFRHPSPIYLTREIKLEGIWPSGYGAGKCFERPSGWITSKPSLTDENLSYF